MTNRRQSLMLLGAGLAGRTAASAAQASTSPQPLKLRLPFSENKEDRRVLDLTKLFFVITNISTERQGVWREWCSWGWFCPKVTIDIRDRRFEFVKAGRHWKKNFADPFHIEPDNHFVLPVNLFSGGWNVPVGFNLLDGVEAIISVSYIIKPDMYTEREKVWTGTLEYQTKALLAKG